MVGRWQTQLLRTEGHSGVHTSFLLSVPHDIRQWLHATLFVCTTRACMTAWLHASCGQLCHRFGEVLTASGRDVGFFHASALLK